MLAYWCLSQNFGDALTCLLVEKITGKKPALVSPDDERKHLIGVGSILNHSRAQSVVWGAGIANMADSITSKADIRLVRGPLSALRVEMCGGKRLTNYGDPALLSSKLFPAIERHFDLGFIPHYADQSHWNCPTGATFINVLDDPETVISEISQCRAVVSSSLHGLIVADSYGIPAAWIYSPRVNGDGTKFVDHFMAVSSVMPSPLFYEQIASINAREIAAMIPARSVNYDAQMILDTFPSELMT